MILRCLTDTARYMHSILDACMQLLHSSHLSSHISRIHWSWQHAGDTKNTVVDRCQHCRRHFVTSVWEGVLCRCGKMRVPGGVAAFIFVFLFTPLFVTVTYRIANVSTPRIFLCYFPALFYTSLMWKWIMIVTVRWTISKFLRVSSCVIVQHNLFSQAAVPLPNIDLSK